MGYKFIINWVFIFYIFYNPNKFSLRSLSNKDFLNWLKSVAVFKLKKYIFAVFNNFFLPSTKF